MSDDQFNKDIYDMASTTRYTPLPTFSGTSSEDITEWASSVKFMHQLYGWDDKTALRQICASLRGRAFELARESILRVPTTTSLELLNNLETRFLSRLKVTETAQRFLNDGVPKTIENFFLMMKDATYLFDRNYMSMEAIADKIIARSPSEIRIALWSLAGQSTNIFDFSNYSNSNFHLLKFIYLIKNLSIF